MSSIFLFRHMTRYRNTEIYTSIWVFHLNPPPMGKNRKQGVNFCISVFCNRHPSFLLFLSPSLFTPTACADALSGRLGVIASTQMHMSVDTAECNAPRVSPHLPGCAAGGASGACGRKHAFDKVALCSQRVGQD